MKMNDKGWPIGSCPLEYLDDDHPLLEDRRTKRPTLTVAGARALIARKKEAAPFLTSKQAEALALWERGLSDAHIGNLLEISASAARGRRLAAQRREHDKAMMPLDAVIRAAMVEQADENIASFEADMREIGHLDPDAEDDR